MNHLKLIDSQRTANDFDVGKLCSTLSSVIGGYSLDPSQDRILLLRPSEINPAPESQNARSGNLVHCIVNLRRDIMLKRCMNNAEFVRRELLVAGVRSKSGFPHYNVQLFTNLLLRDSATGFNYDIVRGWDSCTYLAIDCGEIPAIPLSELATNMQSEIKEEGFLRCYGEWGAFNYLLGVTDRHAYNFVYFPVSARLVSIDNEIGPTPFPEQIAMDMNNSIKGAIRGPNQEASIEILREGFRSGWGKIRTNVSRFSSSLNGGEIELLERHFRDHSEVVARNFFAPNYLT
jgi:hypothetical protein